jgi:MOSC domain-containing protein YiiM
MASGRCCAPFCRGVATSLRRDHNLAPGVTRRNIATRGVPLNYLVGFRAGGATPRSVELCEPCKHVVRVTGIEKLLPTVAHRGGLHAEVLSNSPIQAGDAIEEC